MTSFHDLYSPRNVLFLLGVGSLALVPVAFKRRHQHKPPTPTAAAPGARDAVMLGGSLGVAHPKKPPPLLLPLASVTLPAVGKANGSVPVLHGA